MRESDGSQMSSLFLGSSRQHILVCAKMISSWVRKVWVLVRHICCQVLSEALWVSMLLVTGVSLVSIL